MKPFAKSIWPVAVLITALLAAIALLSKATEDSARFGELYSLLLLVNAAGLLGLAALLVWNLVRLIKQVRRRETGARLTTRMTGIFVLLALTPVLVVYLFSLQTLHRGIESWFDVRIENALSDALALSKTALDIRMREQLRVTQTIANQLTGLEADGLALSLGTALTTSLATELMVVDPRGQIVAASNTDSSVLMPKSITSSLLLRTSEAGTYVDLEPTEEAGLNVRAVAEVASIAGESRYLHALFPVDERMGELAGSVQNAYGKYRELAYLRDNLQFSFTLTLSLVLLLSIFAAAWAAFHSARRMVAPLTGLAEATQAIAEGNYERRVDETSDDELGFLVSSFNDMTRKLRLARDETRRTQAQVEEQRAHLEAVLTRMSSGVITIDAQHRLITANLAAAQILYLDDDHLDTTTALMPSSISDLATRVPRLAPLTDTLSAQLAKADPDWRTEVSLFGPNGHQVLVCRGTALPGPGDEPGGHVVVFDDLTALIQAERNAAWSEVARRLAHEIKNPLTPIQLSAERLRHKYLSRMDGDEASLLDRLTQTIVNQVESMKDMVNAFSAYARSPENQPQPVQLNALVADVVNLYPPQQVHTELDETLPKVDADPDRLRQLLHNLIKNALEAGVQGKPQPVIVVTATGRSGTSQVAELQVKDSGSGIDQSLLPTLFDPYVTNKTKGTGLGLAIVKKIAEENGGVISAANNDDGGATFTLRLPTTAANALDDDANSRSRRQINP